MHRIRKQLILLLSWFVCGLAIGAAWPGWPFGYRFTETMAWLVTIGRHDTQYAQGYSERAFSNIAWGMTEDEVRRTLGDPLVKDSSGHSEDTWWHYTRPASRSCNYHLRWLRFGPDGKVWSIQKSFCSAEWDEFWSD